MPVTVTTESLFSLDAQTIINPVNCVGVMGRGLAKVFARKWPAHEAWYRRQCAQGLIAPGRPQLDRGQDPWILAFPSKRHYRDPSRIEDIDSGLASVARRLPGSGITSLALPALGCGLGGLPFATVLRLVQLHLGPSDIPIWLCEPH